MEPAGEVEPPHGRSVGVRGEDSEGGSWLAAATTHTKSEEKEKPRLFPVVWTHNKGFVITLPPFSVKLLLAKLTLKE